MGAGAISADDRQTLEIVERRFARMGLETTVAPGGRSLLVTLPVGQEPFPLAGGPLRISSVALATAGPNRIKCLSPAPLFHLPLISIAECSTAESIEQRIRAAWRERREQLARARRWLEKLGCSPQAVVDAPVLTLDLGAGDPEARAMVIEPGRVILPGRGPLSGVALQRAEDRVFTPGPDLDSAVDLELAVSGRLEELARLGARLAREAQFAATRRSNPGLAETAAPARSPHILLVGPKLAAAWKLAESLRLRGYRVSSARSATEGMRAFDVHSFELVLADTDLGRHEGIELIASLRRLPGIEELPVILVDDRSRPERSELARRLSGAGYLVHPVEVARIENGLARIVGAPGRRRYTRYTQRVAVRLRDEPGTEIASQLGRGGMFVLSERDVPPHAIEHYELALSEIELVLRVEAEVVYRVRHADRGHPGIGVRFHGFTDRDEELLIAYLRSLEPPAGPV